MEKYTIKDFRKQYPTDAVCLDQIFKQRYGSLSHCPICRCETEFRRVTTRRCYQCKHCYAQFYPCAGTVFEKTTTPLSDWFYVMYMFTTTRNGVAAKEIERAIGCTYKTAWRMAQKIRELIGSVQPGKLKGFVEIDESYMGGRIESMTNDKRKDIAIENNYPDYKTTVIGMVERQGNLKTFKVDFLALADMRGLIKAQIEAKAVISTDESPLYTHIENETGREHLTVNHSAKEYRKGAASTNTIEGFWGHFRSAIRSTHKHVSDKWLQSYLDEFSFRYNYRKCSVQMLAAMLSHIPHVDENGK